MEPDLTNDVVFWTMLEEKAQTMLTQLLTRYENCATRKNPTPEETEELLRLTLEISNAGFTRDYYNLRANKANEEKRIH
jgi:hypothetical protein